jgi:hypothetical protein
MYTLVLSDCPEPYNDRKDTTNFTIGQKKLLFFLNAVNGIGGLSVTYCTLNTPPP